jgi:hypothetical protein
VKHPSLNYKELQELRDLESRFLVALAILKSTLTVVQAIESCGCSLSGAQNLSNSSPGGSVGYSLDTLLVSKAQSLQILRMNTEGYLRSVEVIQQRAIGVVCQVSTAC